MENNLENADHANYSIVHMVPALERACIQFNLHVLGIDINPRCLLCDRTETVSHMLLECSWVDHIWFRAMGLRKVQQIRRY